MICGLSVFIWIIWNMDWLRLFVFGLFVDNLKHGLFEIICAWIICGLFETWIFWDYLSLDCLCIICFRFFEIICRLFVDYLLWIICRLFETLIIWDYLFMDYLRLIEECIILDYWLIIFGLFVWIIWDYSKNGLFGIIWASEQGPGPTRRQPDSVMVPGPLARALASELSRCHASGDRPSALPGTPEHIRASPTVILWRKGWVSVTWKESNVLLTALVYGHESLSSWPRAQHDENVQCYSAPEAEYLPFVKNSLKLVVCVTQHFYSWQAYVGHRPCNPCSCPLTGTDGGGTGLGWVGATQADSSVVICDSPVAPHL